ncbi:DUF6778 family protein [Pseudotabrizicola alkalilacus]|uniref:ABC-type transport auxiliary lipoprotein component domain-containing protein n=1 Tax=Pseudotabrizicola alkalilacus TaxID=2305252 RepID=A0A411Z480_9RHOB|nr:DUF6778 family protein [Pseudotabrizicola alkalilacus]RGP37863.1 hypothetical protein D1012_08195 [Pseudotabrizicola alkalilacus]
MKTLVFPMLAVVMGLSACAGGGPDVMRSDRVQMTLATQGRADPGAGEVRQVLAAQYDVQDIRISVPSKLKVSEANMFYPVADIVWRGEPMGNRHAQVMSIFKEAMDRGTFTMTTGRKVVVDIEVTRFHSVTEKTRYTVGGTHSMRFTLTVRDAETGVVLDGPRLVAADAKAAGGAQAVAEEQMGRTQRVVVVERLASAIRSELSARVTDPMLISQALSQPSDVTLR